MASITMIPNIAQKLVNTRRFVLEQLGFRVFVIGLSCLVLGAFGFLIYHHYWPQAFDAVGYLEIAERYRISGIVDNPEKIRTFGYPWLLALLISIARFTVVEPILLICLFQTMFYFSSVLTLAKVLSQRSTKHAKIGYLVLCGNIFVIPYLSVTLTDSIYVSISLFFFAGLIFVFRDFRQSLRVGPSTYFFATFLASFVVVVRPAGIWILVLSIPILLFMLFRSTERKSIKLLAMAAGSLPLAFQSAINWIQFSKLTFQPAFDLGTLQLMCGISNFKYATRPDWPSAQQYYTSRSVTGDMDAAQAIAWYLSHPLETMQLLGIKLIGAFDFDYLVPYPYSAFNLSLLSGFLSLSVLSLGLVWLFSLLVNKQMSHVFGKLGAPVFLFSWAAVTLFSMVELRFTLPAISVLLVGASCLISEFRLNRSLLLPAFIYAISMPTFWSIAMFIRSQSGITQACF